jgi:hypothetical protein
VIENFRLAAAGLAAELDQQRPEVPFLTVAERVTRVGGPFASPHGGQQERLAFWAPTRVVTARFSPGGRGSEVTKICGTGAVAFPRSLGQVEAD